MSFLFTAANLLFALQATQATVAGTVRDQDSGDPLPGAVVALPDLNRSTASDTRGRRD